MTTITRSAQVKNRLRNKICNRFNYYCWEDVQCMSCNCTGREGCIIEIHHIFSITAYPKLKTDTHNLIPLCTKCHDTFHNLFDIYLGDGVQVAAGINELQIFLNLRAIDVHIDVIAK